MRLGDVCEVERASGPSDDEVWLLNLEVVEKDTGCVARRETVPRSSLGSSTVSFTADSVLYSKLRPNLNKVVLPDSDGYATSEMIPLRPNTSMLTREYLAAYLRSYGFVKYAVESTAGAKMPRVSRRTVFDAVIPLPSIEEQNAVTRRFEVVNSLVMNCHRQLSLLDDLVKSRFVEMFGDPDRNDRDFEVASGRDLFEIGNGKSLPVDRRFDDGIPAYGGNGVSWYTDKALIDFDTVVIGRVGRNCGNTRLVKAPLWVTDNAMYIKGFKRSCFDLVFLINLMNVIDFNRFADEGDLWKISQKPFMEYEFPIPPLSLQREFAAFAARVAKSQFVVQRQTKRGFAEFGLRKLIGGLAAVSDLLRISKKIGNHDVRVGEGITLHLLSTIDDYCIPLRNRYRRFLYYAEV